MGIALRLPRRPRIAHRGVPRRESLRDVVGRGIEGAAERMVGEIDAIAAGGTMPREKRRHVAREPGIVERARSQRGHRARDRRTGVSRRALHQAAGATPISERTSMSSGKNAMSSAPRR